MTRVALLFLAALCAYASNAPTENLEDTQAAVRAEASLLDAYDLPADQYHIHRNRVAPGQHLSLILAEAGLSPQRIHEAVRAGKGIFDVRRMRAGQTYLLLRPGAQDAPARFLVYEENEQDYLLWDLSDEIQVMRGRKLKQLRERAVTGVITSSLYNALAEQGLPIMLTNALDDIFRRRLNVSRVQPGDAFKLIYEEEYSGGEVVGLGRVKAAWFRRDGQEYYAFLYETEHEMLYLDHFGKGTRTHFLKAPIKGGRISSQYARSRLHPVQKRYKAHLGTDYAAPAGTPILAMADGIATEVSRTRYNGLYVKIQHDPVYETGYLHMIRHAEGLKSGDAVKKGQVIGYVGRTGLATGEHVCLRFWKNGRQVNFLQQRFKGQRTEVVASNAQMNTLIKPLKARLDTLQLEPLQQARVSGVSKDAGR